VQAATTSVISRKELGRQLRRQAYQKAKAYRAKDPKYLALKEAAKLRRRELYQQVKQSRKDATSAEKAKRSESRAQAATSAREVREQAQRKRQVVPKRERIGELMQKLSAASLASSPSAEVSSASSSPNSLLAVAPSLDDLARVSSPADYPAGAPPCSVAWSSAAVSPSSPALADVAVANDVS